MKFNKISIVLLAVIGAFALLLPQISWADGEGWLEGWEYRRAVDVANPCATPLSHYQVEVRLDNTFDFTRPATDGSDIRFTGYDGETLLDFWIETWNPSSGVASVWVEVTSLPVSGIAIYMYYGNPSVSSASDGAGTFVAYDGFEGNDVGGPPVAPGPIVGLPWQKYSGKPVVDRGFASVLYDSGTYHMFVSYGSILHYTSTNGKDWDADQKNPVLSGRNQGVPMAWKENGTWYMLYRYGSPTNYIGLATSSNGSDWTEYSGNPVLTGTPGEWDDSTLDPWGVIKVGSTYYLWYNTIGSVPGLGRCTGLATSTDLVNWTKDASNPIFTGGRFCAFPFKYDGYYYLLIPHYTSGSDYSQHELYRDTNPTFYPGEREYLGVAINYGPEGWDDHDQDTPCVLTDTIERDTFAASGNQLWVYYAGEGGDGAWGTGMCIEENIADAIARIEPPANILGWTTYPPGAVTVVDSPARQGIRAVRQNDTISSSTELTGVFSEMVSGVVGGWMRRGPVVGTTDDYDIYLYGENLSCVAGLGRNGYFHYWNGAFQATSVPWEPNKWYLISIAFDAEQKEYDFIVRDEELTELVRVEGIYFGRSSSFINRAMFYTSSQYLGEAYVDEFRIRKYCGADAGADIGFEESWTIPVQIDIKPGADPNPINLRARGLLPVAILGSDTFNVYIVDPATITLGDAPLATRGSPKAPKMAFSYEDVNKDGIMDLMTFFEIQMLALSKTTDALTLSASTFGWPVQPITGSDSVVIVPLWK